MFVRGWTTGVWDFPWRDGRWQATELVDHAIDEEIHHRAQLGIYMRMIGVEPPRFLQRYQDLTDGPEDPRPDIGSRE